MKRFDVVTDEDSSSSSSSSLPPLLDADKHPQPDWRRSYAQTPATEQVRGSVLARQTLWAWTNPESPFCSDRLVSGR